MGRSELEWNRCRRHPKHNNSSGVCPFCLKERLSQISSPLSSLLTMACSSSASSTPYYSSDSDLSSLVDSPVHEQIHRARLALILKEDVESTDEEWSDKKFDYPLVKSRSVIHVVKRKNDSDEEMHDARMEKGKAVMETSEKKEKEKEKEKKQKFWSKFLRGSLRKEGKRKEKSLGHSLTLKEKPSAKWVLF